MVSCLLKHFKRNTESNIIPRFGASRKGAHSKKLLKNSFLKQLSNWKLNNCKLKVHGPGPKSHSSSTNISANVSAQNKMD